MKTLIKKIRVKTTIELVTGLHIGGSKDNVEIGGIDTPVIKAATMNGQPYIPGSSLKGKIRSLLEQIAGAAEVGGGTKKDGQNYKYSDKPQSIREIIDLFGFANDEKPSKIIFRDSYLTQESIELLEKSDTLDMPYTENKFENTIDRQTGVTKKGGIRQIERIPAGVSFDVEIIINVWDDDEDGKKSLELLKNGIHALENDYLGGSGSRGYGQVKFSELITEDIPFDKIFADEN
ncbi:MAG: type III-A CRISPR-associated RAMP protein Csm3 [Bacteroidales bacterium 36-12]|jgi:CRISPR-associated protein Csm3|nr:MAG: type III-A CRISPR-associated RAMP protein Csm3 [Bacteroidales bacterium 36-12]